MSGKETEPIVHPENPQEHLFPIPSYTKETPIQIPQTKEFITTLSNDAFQTLSPVLDSTFVRQNLSKLARELAKFERKLAYMKDRDDYNPTYFRDVIIGLESKLQGFLFEQAAFHYLTNDFFPSRGIEVKVSSPQQTNELYDVDKIRKKLCASQPWVQTDDFLFAKVPLLGNGPPATGIVGSLEYTTKTNLGLMSEQNLLYYKSKYNQFQENESGKVVDYLFSQQPSRTKQKLAGKVTEMFPDLPPRLFYDQELFMPFIVTPQDDHPYQPSRGELVMAPVTPNDLWYTSLSLIQEISQGELYYLYTPSPQEGIDLQSAAD